jgi:hypothetical protein
VPAWDSWSWGPLFGAGPPRPVDPPEALRLCSFDLPVCVHAASAADGPAALETLQEAERALRALRAQALLPWPISDGDQGGTGALDLYLRPLGGAHYRIGIDIPSSFPVDRAPAFGVIERTLRPGCALATAVHRVVATAMLAAIDAGESPTTFASSAVYYAMLSSRCGGEVIEGVDRDQAHPERCPLPPIALDDPKASPLLPWLLDESFGAGTPGSLLTGLWYGAQQSTPPVSPRFQNRPDFIEVLARLAKAREKKLHDILIDLAITRAFLGDRSDGEHLGESAFLGAAGRPRFDASWPVTSLPRRIAFTPLEPLGAVYLWVDLAGARPGQKLGFQATWEYPTSLRWAIVRVDADGHEAGRILPLWQRGVFTVEQEIIDLDRSAGLLLVGVNGGQADLDVLASTDETPYEPHGGTVYLAPIP